MGYFIVMISFFLNREKNSREKWRFIEVENARMCEGGWSGIDAEERKCNWLFVVGSLVLLNSTKKKID